MTLEVLEKDWDEGKHPRDDHGRFAESGGEDGGSSDGGGGHEHPGKGYSASAYIDQHGVIQTTSVYDAQRALAENRKVELDQPRKVSILIHRLGDVSKKMISAGEKAPLFNLCNVTVKGTNLFCADTKGIPRVEMPQLDDKQTKQFRRYLKDEGYKVTKEKTAASHLRATQNELNGAKVAATADKMRDDPDAYSKRIIVSKDDYILDGHHHWAAKIGLDAENGKLEDNTPVRISRVNISITKLLEEAEKFTGGKGKIGVDEKNCFSKLFRDWDESKHPRDEHGEFTDSGGGDGDTGYEFVSPNVRELDFEGAVKELGGARQGVLHDASADINDKLGMDATEHDVVGAWQDGAENSVMDIVGHSNWDKLRLAGDMKGWLADQKSVLLFQQRDQGEGVLASFNAEGNLHEIHDNLVADGVVNHTLVPTPDGATIYVADLDNTQSDAIKKAASRYGSENPIDIHFGHGEFIGTSSYEGTDREQRDRARDVYEADIQRSTIPGSTKIWQGVRDRWGKALATESPDARKIYVRTSLLKVLEIITLARESGVEIVAYQDGADIDGEVIDERQWDAYTQKQVKTLYVHRNLLNPQDVIDWAKASGFNTTLPADDMHVTVAFSKQPVDWDKLTPDLQHVLVNSGSRSVEQFNGGACVLQFDSPELADRWQEFRDAGASWDWPEYKSHVTISYNGEGVDLASIKPYTGPLLFGPEIFQEVNLNWKDDVDERDWDESKHPRDPKGEFTDSGGSDELSGNAIDEFRERYGLHDDEQAKINEWMGSGYREMRSDPEFGKVLEKLPEVHGKVFRGTRMTPERFAKYKAGAKVTIDKFSSASQRRNSAADFMEAQRHEDPAKSVPVMFEIQDSGRRIPKDMAQLAGSDENEVVMMMGDKYKIEAVEPYNEERGNAVIHMKEV